jgi:hypothetical protein
MSRCLWHSAQDVECLKFIVHIWYFLSMRKSYNGGGGLIFKLRLEKLWDFPTAFFVKLGKLNYLRILFTNRDSTR